MSMSRISSDCKASPERAIVLKSDQSDVADGSRPRRCASNNDQRIGKGLPWTKSATDFLDGAREPDVPESADSQSIEAVRNARRIGCCAGVVPHHTRQSSAFGCH